MFDQLLCTRCLGIEGFKSWDDDGKGNSGEYWECKKCGYPMDDLEEEEQLNIHIRGLIKEARREVVERVKKFVKDEYDGLFALDDLLDKIKKENS